MVNAKVVELLNVQVTKEFYSGYLYLAMSNYFYHASLDGFGNWYAIQAREEADHGRKIVQYLLDNDQLVKMGAIDAPKADFENYREPLEMALKHEEYVSSLIDTLYGTARELKDYRSSQFLDWYLAEQVEEEKNARDLLAKYDISGGDARGIFLLDEFLSRRKYEPLG